MYHGVQASVSREEHGELQSRMTAAEKALADKQKKIDDMKQELFEKDKELETISVFKAQVTCSFIQSSNGSSSVCKLMIQIMSFTLNLSL